MQGATKPVFKLHWIGIRISLIWSLYNAREGIKTKEDKSKSASGNFFLESKKI